MFSEKIEGKIAVVISFLPVAGICPKMTNSMSNFKGF
jgi:hypothetical protein